MAQYCNRCATEMRKLSYSYLDCDVITCYQDNVYDSETKEDLGELVYCPNCGSVKINLKMESK